MHHNIKKKKSLSYVIGWMGVSNSIDQINFVPTKLTLKVVQVDS